jgi:hypothetical protein
VPIDWFSPEAFNRLPASLRYQYKDNGIALPLPQHWDKIDEWKVMKTAQFMQQYGNEVLSLYKLPTEAEVRAMERAENGEPDSDADDMDEL